jgi:hypothetical protein
MDRVSQMRNEPGAMKSLSETDQLVTVAWERYGRDCFMSLMSIGSIA